MNTNIEITSAENKMDISKMSKIDLVEKCKELGITKCSSKNKSFRISDRLCKHRKRL